MKSTKLTLRHLTYFFTLCLACNDPYESAPTGSRADGNAETSISEDILQNDDMSVSGADELNIFQSASELPENFHPRDGGLFYLVGSEFGGPESRSFEVGFRWTWQGRVFGMAPRWKGHTFPLEFSITHAESAGSAMIFEYDPETAEEINWAADFAYSFVVPPTPGPIRIRVDRLVIEGEPNVVMEYEVEIRNVVLECRPVDPLYCDHAGCLYPEGTPEPTWIWHEWDFCYSILPWSTESQD